MLINVINVDPRIEIQSMIPDGVQKSKIGREQRIFSVVEQSKRYKLEIKFWEGVVSEILPCVNIGNAHRNIVADAKEKGLPMVCIAEDDFFLSGYGAWEYYLSNIPKVFDIFSAGVYSGQIENGRILNGFSGLTLYTVHSDFYDFFLSANPLDHADRWLGNFCFEKMYRVVQPFCVTQLHGYSDNTRSHTTHKDYAEGKLFGR